jgi:hypothetical protein
VVLIACGFLTHIHMDSIGPVGDELLTREIAAVPRFVLLPPRLLEPQMTLGLNPLASVPRSACNGSAKSPIDMPFKEIHGINSSMDQHVHKCGGRMAEVRTTRSLARRALSPTRRCSISSGPAPVTMVCTGRKPFRAACCRLLSSVLSAWSAKESLHLAFQGSPALTGIKPGTSSSEPLPAGWPANRPPPSPVSALMRRRSAAAARSHQGNHAGHVGTLHPGSSQSSSSGVLQDCLRPLSSHAAYDRSG